MTRIVVGFDLKAGGDRALLDALAHLADADAMASAALHLVHVVDQRALDATGALEGDQKRAIATERAYPEVWKQAKKVAASEFPFELPSDTTVHVRFAPVHMTRTNEEIARQILQVAVDFDAPLVVLGRRLLPESVADHARIVGAMKERDGSEPQSASVFLVPAHERIELAKSEAWTG